MLSILGIDRPSNLGRIQRSVRSIVAVGLTTALAGALIQGPAAAATNPAGSPDTVFNQKVASIQGVAGVTSAVAIQPDGKIVVTGSFNYAGSTALNNIARFNSDGSEDIAFNENIAENGGLTGGFFPSGFALAIQPDGKIVVGGNFTDAAGTSSVDRLARFNADGTEDESFNQNVKDSDGVSGSVNSLALTSTGSITITGNFNSAGGTLGVNSLARFNSGGTPDTAFNGQVREAGGIYGSGQSVAIDKSGKVVVTGSFTDIGRTTGVNHLARFAPTGSADDAFNEAVAASGGLSHQGLGVAVDQSGNVTVVGEFLDAGGTTDVNRLARYKTDGTPDTGFNQAVATASGLSGNGYGAALDSTDGVIVAGDFRDAGGTTGVNGLARFTSTGTADAAFNSQVKDSDGFGSDQYPTGLVLDSQSKITLVGNFLDAGGTEDVNGLARFYGKAATPPNPPVPPKPAAKTKQQLKAGAAPKRIKKRGVTVINKRGATTKQGRALKATVKPQFTRGEVRCFTLKFGKKRKVTIRTYGQCSFRLKVTYRAAGNSKYLPLKVTKTYRVRG